MNDNQYRVLNIRQKMSFGGRIHGTEHGNPDFAALARDFGAAGYRIESDGEARQVVERALAEEGPVVVEVVIDPEELPPLNLEASLRMTVS
jgi:acetolactate synthase-1/2/3 large subunit